jgi:hypothetical protein
VGHQRRLPDRDVGDQPRVGQRGRSPSHCVRQVSVQRQPEPITHDRLMRRGHATGQRHRRRGVENLTDLELVEIGSVGHRRSNPIWPYKYMGIGWQYGSLASNGRTFIERWDTSAALSDEETMLVDTVRAFIDKEVKPSVREVEHARR